MAGGKNFRLEENLRYLEAASTEEVQILKRQVNAEWLKFASYKKNLIEKEQEVLSGKEILGHLSENKHHAEKQLSAAESRLKSLCGLNEELKRNLVRCRREEEKISKAHNTEKARLDDILSFYQKKWDEHYESSYANKPIVQEYEAAKKALADSKDLLKNLKSNLRDCQADVFKAKCERGKRNAEESGFYPLKSFIIRIAKIGVEIKKYEYEEIEISRDISSLQKSIQTSGLKIRARETKKDCLMNLKEPEMGQTNTVEEMSPLDPKSSFEKFENFKTKKILERNISVSKRKLPINDIDIQDKIPSYQSNLQSTNLIEQNSTLMPVNKISNLSAIEGRVRNRLKKLKLYTPKFYSPPEMLSKKVTDSVPIDINGKEKAFPQVVTIDNQKNLCTLPYKPKYDLYSRPNVDISTRFNDSQKFQEKTKVQKMQELHSSNNEKTAEGNFDLNKSFHRRSTIPAGNCTSTSFTSSENDIKNTNISNIPADYDTLKKFIASDVDAEFHKKKQPLSEPNFMKEREVKKLRERIIENKRDFNRESQSGAPKCHNEQISQDGIYCSIQQQKKADKSNAHYVMQSKSKSDQVRQEQISRPEYWYEESKEKELSVANNQRQYGHLGKNNQFETMEFPSTDKSLELNSAENTLEAHSQSKCLITDTNQNLNMNEAANNGCNIEAIFLEDDTNDEKQKKTNDLTCSSTSIAPDNIIEEDEDFSTPLLPKINTPNLNNQVKANVKTNPPSSCYPRSQNVYNTPDKVVNSKSDEVSSIQAAEFTDFQCVERETEAGPGSQPYAQKSKSISQNSSKDVEMSVKCKSLEASSSSLTYPIPEGVMHPYACSSKSTSSSIAEYYTPNLNEDFSKNSPSNFHTSLLEGIKNSTKHNMAQNNNKNGTGAPSPFDFEKHRKALGELKQSPVYVYQSRLMYSPKNSLQMRKDSKSPEVTEALKSTKFNPITFFNKTEIIDDCKQSEQDKSKEEKSEFLSFAYEDYLNDSTSSPEVEGKEKSMFSFGCHSPKTPNKSPGFFPLFSANTQESTKNTKSDFVLNFDDADNIKSPENGTFKFLF